MSTDSITIEKLVASHITDLRGIKANPRHPMQPQRRDLLRRLGLIVPTEPPRDARIEGARLKAPAPRAHALTELGREVEAKAPPEVARPRTPPKLTRGRPYISDLLASSRFRR